MRTDVFIHYGRDAPEVPAGWKIVRVPAGGFELTAPDGKVYRAKMASAVRTIVEAHGK
jgi:hypothetical protein